MKQVILFTTKTWHLNYLGIKKEYLIDRIANYWGLYCGILIAKNTVFIINIV